MNPIDASNEELLAELHRRLENKKDVHELEEEVRRLSKQLRESEKGKSTFLSNVRNEINNPLTSIMGLAQHISKLSQDEKVSKMGTWITQQAFELDYQIRNIMVAAEIEMGEVIPASSQINIGSLIENQIDYLKTRIEHSKIQIKFNLNPEYLIFRSDPYFLQTIFVNLLANAIEFSDGNKEVIINIWCEEEILFIQIQDFGIGIDTEKQENIFGRFCQLDTGLTKVHHGQGLGLSIVQELIDILGGKMQLKSELNKGTTVTLQIPSIQSTRRDESTSDFGNELLFTEGEVF